MTDESQYRPGVRVRFMRPDSRGDTVTGQLIEQRPDYTNNDWTGIDPVTLQGRLPTKKPGAWIVKGDNGRLYEALQEFLEVIDVERTENPAKMPRTQYHGTSRENAEAIMRDGFKLHQDPRTWGHNTSAIFTAGDPASSRLYGRVIIEIEIDPKAKYLTRTMKKSIRRGENGMDAVERWLAEATAGGYAGVYVPDQQSGIGNMTIDPSVLRPIRFIEVESNPWSPQHASLAAHLARGRTRQ